jgi:hypothetical protein
MHIRNYAGYFIVATLLIIACQPKADTPGTPEATVTSVDASLSCTSLGEDENGIPKNLVVLYLNGKKHQIDTITACENIATTDYNRYGIPAEAATACGGWWAGAGDYFYATVEGNVCMVMQGWQDEQQEDEGFHYEQVRRFVVSEK